MKENTAKLKSPKPIKKAYIRYYHLLNLYPMGHMNLNYKLFPIRSIGERVAFIQLFIFIPFSVIFLLFCFLSIDKMIQDSVNDSFSSIIYGKQIKTDNTAMQILAIVFLIVGCCMLAFSLYYYFRIKKIKKQISEKIMFIGLKLNSSTILETKIHLFKIKEYLIHKADILSLENKIQKGKEVLKITTKQKIYFLQPSDYNLDLKQLLILINSEQFVL